MDILNRIFTIIGAIVSLIIIISVMIFLFGNIFRPGVRSNTILEIDFDKGFIETSPDNLIYKLTTAEQLNIFSVVNALNVASKDKRIKGLIAHISDGLFSYADVQEIRNAIIRFRKSGKSAIIYSESFGESYPGNSTYYLASSFDTVNLQPSGNLSITGILSESYFFKGTLNKLDIKAELTAREEFKTARNQFTETEYTQAHREMSQNIINSVFDQITTDIAFSRKLSKDSINNLLSQGPFSARQALEKKLVDNLQYRDQVYQSVRNKFGKRARFLYLTKYIQRTRPKSGRKKGIALIYVNGAIVKGQSRYNPMNRETVIGAKTITNAFRDAIKDRSIGAIVLRINSPGGSYIGSDMIWRQNELARKAGKPVVATMGSVAGSGGYFIAMNADKIIANPSTITGSIGVVSGKFVYSGLYNKLGVSSDRVFTSSNATMWSSSTEYTQKQWQNIQQSIDSVYSDFMNKVASGRNLTIEQVRSLSGGRIYTGNEAMKSGLVDTLGGFTEAIETAKSLMKIPADRTVGVKIFPKRRTFMETFFGRRPDNSEEINNINNGLFPEKLYGIPELLLSASKLPEDNEVLKMPEFTLH